MKSAQIRKYGGSDVVEITQNGSIPNMPAEGKVLVAIKVAGINPVDWKIREGYFQQMIGAFAEMAMANAETIAHKPKSLSHTEAAALPLVGVSAWQALMENIKLSGDQKVLIHGGAGGIGSIAIPLAKHLVGAHVATTASTDDKKFVQELGADEVIDYKTQNFEDILNDYDAVFDTIGSDTYKRSFKVLKKDHGIIVSMLEQPNSELMNQHGVKAIFQFTQVNRERLTKLADWVDQNNNKIRVNIDKEFSLDEAIKALDYQRDKHPRGKIVLTM